jgi:glycosyltransferase involved in cell wall biosynthesis
LRNKYLKILFAAADRFPPFRVDVAVLFGQEIAGRGHRIDWLLQSDKPLDHDIETKLYGGRAWVGRTDTGPSLWNRIRLHFFNFLNDFKMFRLMAKTPYDIILVRDKYIAGVMAVLASKFFKTKFVYWLSFPMAEASIARGYDGTAKYPILYRIRGYFYKILLYRIILPNAVHGFVQTDEMKRQVALRGVPETKMTAVPMAVDTNKIKFVGYQPKNTLEEKIVLYLGALNKFRRIDFILRVFKKVLEAIPNAKLILVGGSDVKTDEIFLHSESNRLGISDATTLTGRLPQEEAFDYVKISDVCLSYIYPSPIFDVGSPTKLLEYMAMGKASVANDHPEQRVVLSKSQAGICVPSDESAFAAAVVHLLENPSEAEQMGFRGRKYIEANRSYKETADVVARKLLQIAF